LFVFACYVINFVTCMRFTQLHEHEDLNLSAWGICYIGFFYLFMMDASTVSFLPSFVWTKTWKWITLCLIFVVYITKPYILIFQYYRLKLVLYTWTIIKVYEVHDVILPHSRIWTHSCTGNEKARNYITVYYVSQLRFLIFSSLSQKGDGSLHLWIWIQVRKEKTVKIVKIWS